MKTCVVRKRFWSTETSNQTIRVDLPPNFGVPKACMIYYVETSAITDSFDTSTTNRNFGVGMVGPAGDGTTTLKLHCSWITSQRGSNPTAVARQNSNTNAMYAHDVTRATIYYRCTAVGFTTDAANFTFATATPQTNGHLDTIMWFINGDDVTVGVGTHPIPTAGLTSSFTSFNFQPDALLLATPITALNAGLTDDCRMTLGAVTRSPYKQAGTYWHFEGAAATVDLSAITSSTQAINFTTNNSVGPYFATIDSLDATGFTMTNGPGSASGSNNFLMFLGIKSQSPTDFALHNTFSTATSTGIRFSGLGSTGFIPETMLGSMTNATIDTSRIATSPGADSINVFAGFASSESKYYPGFGTLTSSTGSTILSGTGTSFYRLSPGDKVYDNTLALLGTISTVVSNTSAYLTANAAKTVSPTASFVYTIPGQYSISFGDQDGSTGSVAYSQLSSYLIDSTRSSAGSPSDLVQGYLVDFDSRPGYQLSFTTVDATARLGWIMAFKNQAIVKRRSGVN